MKLTEIIAKRLRTLMIESSDGEYSYGCAMLDVNIPDSDWSKLQVLIDDDEVYDNKGFGREDEPHITLLYGLHDTVDDNDIKETVEEFDEIMVTLSKVGFFTNDKFDVIKYELSDKQLFEMNTLLKEFPHTSSYPIYEPHLTIAYVKKGLGDEIAKRFNKEESLEYLCGKVRYTKANKEKKYFKLNKK